MSLREQFEAWYRKKHSIDQSIELSRTELHRGVYCNFGIEQDWQAYQAGHAVNADLLEALEESLALNINWSETASEEQLGHLSEYKRVIKQAREAIKKARAE